MLAKKIYKAIEDHSKVLKKTGSCLSKLKESKLKKLVHLGINEEEEKPKGDEYIVAHICDKWLKISTHILMKALECKMRVLL